MMSGPDAFSHIQSVSAKDRAKKGPLYRQTWLDVNGAQMDVVVIGGGIQGAGVARDAALRGLRVALIEAGDWASGTSSRSSKLLHGGLRYLQYGALAFVRESVTERELNLRMAGSLARRLRFKVVPGESGPNALKLRLGVGLYDALTLGKSHSRVFGRSISYEDVQINDAGFCLTVVRNARDLGATALNYTRAVGWETRAGRVVGVRLLDGLTGETGVVYGKHIVNAAGPWASLLSGPSDALRLTRGAHVVLRGLTEDGCARLFFAPQDGRVVFVIPYLGGTSLVGTTDLDHTVPSHDPEPSAAEIQYLSRAFQTVFPAWRNWQPVGWQCGLRPLLAQAGDPSSLSREERIHEDNQTGILSVLGGKYTTFRLVSERVVDRITGGKAPRDRSTRVVPLTVYPAIQESGGLENAFNEQDAATLEDCFFRRTWLGHGGGSFRPGHSGGCRGVGRSMGDHRRCFRRSFAL